LSAVNGSVPPAASKAARTASEKAVLLEAIRAGSTATREMPGGATSVATEKGAALAEHKLVEVWGNTDARSIRTIDAVPCSETRKSGVPMLEDIHASNASKCCSQFAAFTMGEFYLVQRR
jgi:hypothetical protein